MYKLNRWLIILTTNEILYWIYYFTCLRLNSPYITINIISLIQILQNCCKITKCFILHDVIISPKFKHKIMERFDLWIRFTQTSSITLLYYNWGFFNWSQRISRWATGVPRTPPPPPPRAEPKWYKYDRMNLLFQNQNNLDWKHLIYIYQDGRR